MGHYQGRYLQPPPHRSRNAVGAKSQGVYLPLGKRNVSLGCKTRLDGARMVFSAGGGGRILGYATVHFPRVLVGVGDEYQPQYRGDVAAHENTAIMRTVLRVFPRVGCSTSVCWDSRL